MPVFQHRPASPDDFPAILAFLPTAQLGCTRDEAHAHWLRWTQQGALSVGIVEAFDGQRSPVIAGCGITVWISDEAVERLHSTPQEIGSAALYRAATDGESWLLDQLAIERAHSACSLNLWILHFWPDPDPGNPDFAAFFIQSVALFRELHDGFGVGRLFQEVPAQHVPMMQAAGMRVVRAADANRPRALVSLTRADARSGPGSMMSFLFLSPPAKLGLKRSEQCMVSLALRQLTDEDIAGRMGCSREYIRKLWSRVYDALHANAGLAHDQASAVGPNQRGREKRRRALEFLRDHPEELRPGLPAR